MITILSAPPTLSLSKDRMVYEFGSDSFQANAGLEAIGYVSFTSAVVADTQLPLRWNGSVQTFVAKTSPTSNGAQFPTGNGTMAYVQSLVPYFQANVFLSDDFTVTAAQIASDWCLVFTAKKKGAAYNFTKLAWQSGQIKLFQEGGDVKRALNHCIQVRIFLANAIGNGFEMVFSENLPSDDAGKVTVDVADLLHPYLNRTPDVPLWPGMVYQLFKKTIRAYYLQIADGSGSPVQLGNLTTLLTKYVALGGSGYGRQSRLSTLFVEAAKYKALRLGATTRIIIKDAPQWLTFLNETTTRANVLVKLKAYFTDNTNQTITAMTVSTWGRWEKLTFEAGPLQRNLYAINTGKTLFKYEIWLQIGTAVMSEVYTYILNDNTYLYRKYFTFQNSLGAFDTLSVWGAQESKANFTIQTASKFLPQPYSVGDAEEFQYHSSQQQSFKCYVEFDNRAHQAFFRDFMRSPYRFRFAAGQCYPIGINSGTINDPAEDENLLFGEFEYKYLFNETAELIP